MGLMIKGTIWRVTPFTLWHTPNTGPIFRIFWRCICSILLTPSELLFHVTVSGWRFGHTILQYTDRIGVLRRLGIVLITILTLILLCQNDHIKWIIFFPWLSLSPNLCRLLFDCHIESEPKFRVFAKLPGGASPRNNQQIHSQPRLCITLPRKWSVMKASWVEDFFMKTVDKHRGEILLALKSYNAVSPDKVSVV